MTITESDEGAFQSKITSFHGQHEEDACYPTAIKNALDSFEEEAGGQSANLSLSDIKEICGYKRGFGCREELVQANLNAELRQYRLEVQEEIGFDYTDIEEILDNDAASMPIVELDPEYWDRVDGYSPQADSEQVPYSHTVLVFKINFEEILFHDPFETFFKRSSRIEEVPYRMNRTEFYELWQGDYDPGWTLWIEESEQQTFAGLDQSEGNQ